MIIAIVIQTIVNDKNRAALYDAINNRPLTSSENLIESSNKGNLIRTVLYTSSNLVSQSGNEFAYLRLYRWGTWRSGRSDTSGWILVEDGPEAFDLFSKDRKLCVHVVAKDIDFSALPELFDTQDAQQQRYNLPRAWSDMTTAKNRYRLIGLPAGIQVTTAGNFVKLKSGLTL